MEYLGTVLLATEATDNGQTGSVLGLVLPLLVLGGLFYFMIVMPQRRRMKAVETMRASVEVGDEVRTIGGMYGKVLSIDDSDVTLDVGGTRIRFTRKAIAERLGGEIG
ncbi:MAG: preprotein translocase subunit YajC [Acidimicrobiia bacterium]|nr:preprotein translocase subunit YajC [Acidimicrobiia bacterium]